MLAVAVPFATVASCSKGKEHPADEPGATAGPTIDARSWKTIKLPAKPAAWKFPARPQPAPQPPPAPGANVPELCRGRFLTWLVVDYRGKRLHTINAREALRTFPGATRLEGARRGRDRALPVTALLATQPGARALRLHSCDKPPRELSRTAAAEWMLVTNRKGQLKLIGSGVSTKAEPLRRVVLIELLDTL